MSSIKGSTERVQRFGRFLSGMVLPNIGAFLAWGIITAFFIPKGWFPNAQFAKLVGPMITYLLPLLLGYTGGKMVGNVRGGVLGAIATAGVIVGTDIPMFMGAMIMGPLSGYIIKKFDQAIEGKIKAGFEMLVNTFSIGIFGSILSVLALSGIGPVVSVISKTLGNGVQALINAGLLPLASIFVEPAKILFLNNAINHGVLTPLGLQQAAAHGKSILFLIETNPGPGLGILLAYWVFSKGLIKESAPTAMIIHFIGGIHEIYFPYVLMNPFLILAVIAGGASGVFTNVVLGSGLIAPPAPGSIFALIAMAPKGGLLPVLAGVAVAAIVSFLVASVFVKLAAGKTDESELEAAKTQVKEIKNVAPVALKATRVKRIIFACDAGMGSSAMGATSLKNKLKKAGLDVDVVNYAVNEIPADAEMVVTHESLTERAKNHAPKAEHISIKNFMNAPEYEIIVKELSK